MRHLRPHLIAIALLSAVGPTMAQEAVVPSAAASKAIWCGAAFAIAGQRAEAAGDSVAAGVYADSAGASFAIAAGELIALGLTVEQFRALAEAAAAEVTAPFRETSFPEADCAPVAPE